MSDEKPISSPDADDARGIPDPADPRESAGRPSHNESSDAALPPDAPDEELPPVKPPSAGFIIQLFLVPGLIVLVVIGVWALFGKMASGEQDWRKLVEEIRHENPHRRWRGATGLAQLLQADQKRGDQGQKLASNPEVAEALAGMLREQLQSKSNKPDDIAQQAFLARALGMLDVNEVVLPVLIEAMQPGGDKDSRREIRKNAIASVAVIAGRAADRDDVEDPAVPGQHRREIVEFDSLLDTLIGVSRESSGEEDRLIRRLAAFTLGLLPSPRSRERLRQMLDDGDEMTRMNAAIALARQNSTQGYAVFRPVLEKAGTEEYAAAFSTPEEETTSRYLWIGIAVAALFIFAVWAAGTSKRSSRMIAAALSLAALTYVCYGIYEMVQDRPDESTLAVDSSDASGEKSAEETFVERSRKARAERFERLVMVKNALKAVTDLANRWTPQERSQLITLVERVADQHAPTRKHAQPRIRIDAEKALRALRGEEAK